VKLWSSFLNARIRAVDDACQNFWEYFRLQTGQCCSFGGKIGNGLHLVDSFVCQLRCGSFSSDFDSPC
jgi:hypothetical protein